MYVYTIEKNWHRIYMYDMRCGCVCVCKKNAINVWPRSSHTHTHTLIIHIKNSKCKSTSNNKRKTELIVEYKLLTSHSIVEFSNFKILEKKIKKLYSHHHHHHGLKFEPEPLESQVNYCCFKVVEKFSLHLIA